MHRNGRICLLAFYFYHQPATTFFSHPHHSFCCSTSFPQSGIDALVGLQRLVISSSPCSKWKIFLAYRSPLHGNLVAARWFAAFATDYLLTRQKARAKIANAPTVHAYLPYSSCMLDACYVSSQLNINSTTRRGEESIII